MTSESDRRGFLRGTSLGAAGLGAACSLEERILLAAVQEGDGSAAKPKPDIAPASMPCGTIGKVRISRLFLGGNLIGGWAHSRDLTYVSSLFKAYNTEAKIFETLELAEQCGINTVLIDPRDFEPCSSTTGSGNGVSRAWSARFPASKGQAGRSREATRGPRREPGLRAWHRGRPVCHGRSDRRPRPGHPGDQAQGLPAGVGGHSLETPRACEKHALGADFYVKTFHTDRYWSATPPENREEWCWYKPMSAEHGRYHDNMFCLDADKVADFMESLDKPGSPSRRWPPARSRRGWRSRSPSARGPTSSWRGCSTSSSSKMRSWPSRPSESQRPEAALARVVRRRPK